MSDPGLTINGRKFPINDPLIHIGSALGSDVTHLEIWLVSQNAHMLSALANTNHSFLIWMTPDCPEGWHTRATDYPQDNPSELEFRLANGQIDMFSEDLCIPRKSVLKAFCEFWEDGQRSPSVNWIYT